MLIGYAGAGAGLGVEAAEVDCYEVVPGAFFMFACAALS